MSDSLLFDVGESGDLKTCHFLSSFLAPVKPMTRKQWIILLLTLIMQAVIAQTDNPFTASWTGPSTRQSFEASDSDIESFIMRKAAFPLFLAALGILVLLGSPCVCCFRYCCQCCGSSNMRPGHLCCGGAEMDYLDETTKMRKYTRTDVLCNRYSTYAALVLAVIFLIMAFTGAARLAAIPSNITKGISRTVDWVLNILQKLIDAAVDSSASGIIVESNSASTMNYVDGFDYTKFAAIKRSLASAKASAVNAADSSSIAFTVPAYIGFALAAPTMVIALGVISAFCNCRICLPYLTVCSSVLMQFVAFLLACIILLILIPINVVCGEVDAQIEKTPGLFQWYIVPQCEQTTLISSASQAMETAQSGLGTLACDKLRSLCTSNTSSGTPYLQCDSTKLASCQKVSQALDILGSSVVMSTSACASSATTSCTVQECALTCTDPSLQLTSKAAMKSLRIGVRLLNAMETYLFPNIKCNVLIDKVLESVPVPLCNDLRGGLNLLAAAAIIAGITLLATIVLMFRGQKRFFDIDALPPAPAADAPSNIGVVCAPLIGYGMDPYVNPGSHVEMSTMLYAPPPPPLVYPASQQLPHATNPAYTLNPGSHVEMSTMLYAPPPPIPLNPAYTLNPQQDLGVQYQPPTGYAQSGTEKDRFAEL
jgi:hypothetical protein